MGTKGYNSSDAESLRGRRMSAEGAKSLKNVTSSFFNTVHLLPEHLKFEHGGTKLASCPGRHLTSLRSWPAQRWRSKIILLGNRFHVFVTAWTASSFCLNF